MKLLSLLLVCSASLLLLWLPLLPPVAAQSPNAVAATPFLYTLVAPSLPSSPLQLLESDSGSLDTSSEVVWEGRLQLDEVDGIVTATPPSAVLPFSTFHFPGVANASYAALPDAYLALKQLVAEQAAAAIDPRLAPQLYQLWSDQVWLQHSLNEWPLVKFVSTRFQCGLVGMALQAEGEEMVCWDAMATEVESSSFVININSSLSTENEEVFPLHLTLSFTPRLFNLLLPNMDELKSQALLLLFYRMQSHLHHLSLLDTLSDQVADRMHHSRVALGFFWTFLVGVMLFVTIMAATFQSWLYPLFPLRYAGGIWLLLTWIVVISISATVGFLAFLILAVILAGYCAIVGVAYYIMRVQQRETPALPQTDKEQQALRRKKEQLERADAAAAAEAAAAAAAMAAAASHHPPRLTLPHRDSVATPTPGSLDLDYGEALLLEAPSRVVSYSDLTTRSLSIACQTPLPLSQPYTFTANDMHEALFPVRHTASSYSTLTASSINTAQEQAADFQRPLSQNPDPLGYVQRRVLFGSSLLFLLCIVLAVVVFSIWRVQPYPVVDRTGIPAAAQVEPGSNATLFTAAALQPMNMVTVEHLPQTLSKGVAWMYAFDGMASGFHLDALLSQFSHEWCYSHSFMSPLDTAEEKYASIESAYVQRYGVDMIQYDPPSYLDYTSLDEWLIRRPRPEFRPTPSETPAVASPADGRIRAWAESSKEGGGRKRGERDLQRFLTEAASPSQFEGGSLVLLRLSTPDAHRFHSVLTARLLKYFQVEGGESLLEYPDAIRSGNEVWFNRRTVLLFHSDAVGEFAMVILEGMCAGQTFGGVTLRPPPSQPETVAPTNAMYARGEELGYAPYGAMVALLFQPGTVRFHPDLLLATQRGVETQIHVNARIGVMTSTETSAQPSWIGETTEGEPAGRNNKQNPNQNTNQDPNQNTQEEKQRVPDKIKDRLPLPSIRL